uniref:G_PROTEIN_RECEP_F1_2 domain-containing protein n=1 Tax=Angiostrongylus cantonensis TaxID=6313 RepID=A0A0K0D8X9_ANGCA
MTIEIYQEKWFFQVILVVLWKREMRTNRNVLIVNLALSNLVLALINIPFLWLPSIDFEFPYSRFFCKFA